ncbi:MAG TPA: phytoene/squalene synthase family protein [Polyangia bacterium]|jgi:phytoene synthase|nr:phytoene/squalene synthase family protein [Polyangia bacterium]
MSTQGGALLEQADVSACRGWIAKHSKSFYLSSLLLPRRVRHAAWALYAFCRRADDAVDTVGEPTRRVRARVTALGRRLAEVYDRATLVPSDPIDRAYSMVARGYGIPRALPEELLAGLATDLQETRYRGWDDLYLYCFRVASTVGLMMTRIMGWSRADAFLRAADLGIAMQLTNIARDVGEDARLGRVYLPDELLDACGTSRARVLTAATAPMADAALREAVRRLIERAAVHYQAAGRGIPLLPRPCRLAIAASRRIYAAIGDDLATRGYDPLVRRAGTSLSRKLALVARSLPVLASAPRASQPGPADDLIDRWLDGVGLDGAARDPHGRMAA